MHVEHCMGTVFTVDVRDPGDWVVAIDDVVAWLHHVDVVFSTYRADSDISRMARGELTAARADPEVATVLDLCARVAEETDGYFNALRGGQLDPTGLVKGWAIERAAALLRRHGSADHAVNGGGDLQLAGGSAPGTPWTVGISDPRDSQRVVTTVSGTDFALATSGTAERGAHLADPFTGVPLRSGDIAVASVSVRGPSLTRADAYATAGFVMSARDPLAALRWIAGVDGYEAFVVGADHGMWASPGW